MPTGADSAFWRVPLAQTFDHLGARREGLTEAEARRRLDRFGRNVVAEPRRMRLLLRIGRRFVEPLVAVLLVAAAISGFTGDAASFFIILSVILVSVTLDVVQEHRAEAAAEALKRSVAIHADVRRDGEVVAVAVEQIVPGDVVELRAGDLMPADGLVIESRDAHVNEALLTGEPFPRDKRAGPCDAASPSDAFNALFAGSSVVSGELRMLVVATGAATRFGGIAAALAEAEPPSALSRGVHRLGFLILRLTVFLVLFVLLVHLAFGRPALESFLFALALAVGLTPELLPMIMTVTLSRGALRLSAKSVVVKRLAAIHDLGAMDVLCTDKTGTLTEARIALIGHPGVDGADDARVLTLAAVSARLGSGIRSPLDAAILAHCERHDLADWTILDEVPFDFERRCVSVLAQHDAARMLISKGAPEPMLARATAIDLGGGRTAPLDAATRARLEGVQAEQGALGNRLLAIAWKPVAAERREIVKDDECDLVFLGFCVFVDPPKASAGPAIARLARLGVAVKIVSGDHEAVVRHLAQSLGLSGRRLLTGDEIAGLSEAALAARVGEVDLFARVTPDQKTRIIRALQARGRTLGFIGDGVNDAPAIRAAEVGLSVDGATDVARSAADIILTAQDLGVVADGVEEGRRTFANILKYVRMGTSSNFGNMLSMALASLALPFLPLLPVQILLNNLLYDLSEIGIPLDRVDASEVAEPRAWDMGAILRFTVVMGALSSAFDIATFVMLMKVFDASPELFRTAWFVESTATQILVIFIIRTQRPLWSGLPHPLLAATSLGALAAALAIVLSPARSLFGFVALPATVALATAGLVAAYLVAAEFGKRFAIAPRRRKSGDHGVSAQQNGVS